MATHVSPLGANRVEPFVELAPGALKYLAPIGRLLFSAIFILSVPGHFSSRMVDYAAQHGVPVPQLAVPVAGIIALAGGLSVLLGFRARVGAWLLMVFLLPVTVLMHDFWNAADANMMQMELVNFLKNVAIFGGALLVAFYGAGPYSFDHAHTTEQGDPLDRMRGMGRMDRIDPMNRADLSDRDVEDRGDVTDRGNLSERLDTDRIIPPPTNRL